eukprot:m.14963 g.14963  ORF g.14963 m.14963 type:complete len:207 (-) comp10363_c0_seq1:99-719(-)
MFSFKSVAVLTLVCAVSAQDTAIVTQRTPCEDGFTCVVAGDYWCGDRLEIKTPEELARVQSVCYIQGHVSIAACKGCTVVDMPALEAIGGNFTLVGTEVSHIDGFNNVASIGGDMHYLVHSSLESSNGFKGLKHVGGNFYFGINKKLTTVEGFNHPDGINVGGHIYVASNENMDHHNFLDNINCHGGINKCENCPDTILSRDPCEL